MVGEPLGTVQFSEPQPGRRAYAGWRQYGIATPRRDCRILAEPWPSHEGATGARVAHTSDTASALDVLSMGRPPGLV